MSPEDHKNIFRIPEGLPLPEEFSERLFSGRRVLIERIISHGHRSPEDVWFDQDQDEWVALLQGNATLLYDDGRTLAMGQGDWVFIPAHSRHRVQQTSSEPPCIWLAVHVPHESAG